MNKHAIAGIIFAVSLIADILTKWLVVSKIALHERIDVIGSFVQLTLVYNRGGLFGILQGYQAVFLVVSLVVLAIMIAFYVFEKNKTQLFCVSMALIASGAIGNISDRFIGMLGIADRPGVVDFVYIGSDAVFRWPAFNIADAAIVVGAGLLLIVFFVEEKRRKRSGAA
ncbi:MAG TPA: signal peptidase II [Spirochaetota bacterium]|nr:signal peptidase II [Spirochaetota bacterium]HNT09527.1 signal peptidase II [Spirochaetota bacterium]HNV46360.1 signal peptidase II [Spirochaetota bacterium]HPU89493.1 signal peptidase II [Spirochaetota bacterium]